MLDGYGLRMRAPYAVEDLAVSVSSLLEGFALQWKRQPTRTEDPLGEDGWVPGGPPRGNDVHPADRAR
jgi:hypothetical protein